MEEIFSVLRERRCVRETGWGEGGQGDKVLAEDKRQGFDSDKKQGVTGYKEIGCDIKDRRAGYARET